MNGTPKARQFAAAGLDELVRLASPACLKAFSPISQRVCACSGPAFVHLVALSPRIDPLITELTAKIALTMVEELDPSPLGGAATTLAVPAIPTLVALARDENLLVKSSSLTALSLAVKALVTGFSDTANKVVNRTALRIVKRMAKVVPKHVRQHSGTLVPPIFALIKSPTSTSSSTLSEYRASAEQGKLLAEYGRHVLSKLKVNGDDSDNEGVE
ncbi:hypothetical protein SPRG_12089 [Saprolegnia parasitica CBS 223.65]|uniref:Uncharacterized protein n=1 Tax=Saprolegnia parasitica (strain CBS 223.65) TaxID=695850 RepID=A0A067BZI3_SAPPC|nr:hypothetical protein SPRG_12089 [Saprolegnia parasitica CBS 223.65]KDO22250.1 hypothetical protein SPRG_12089 [Saprolegnia parasitica CBS 223.65]|eukprot:XP_012206987.1 hypothetical protein SPRG_12089 [Saprolegnia parasitica CBS 223.65]